MTTNCGTWEKLADVRDLLPGGLISGDRHDLLHRLGFSRNCQRIGPSEHASPALAVLDALMGLPAGIAVPLSDLTERERRVLRRALRDAVEHDGVHLVCRAVAPVSTQVAVARIRAVG